MQTFRSATAFILFLIAGAACGPQGQVTRTLHPALNLAARQTHDQRVQAAAALPRTRPGLPIRCLLEQRTREQFCISCDEKGIDLERCYTFHGTFDEQKHCVYSLETIKCLSAAPPFALHIAIKGSLEKTLLENTRFWQESLRAIVRPRLTPDLQAALEHGLQTTEALVLTLVRARKSPQWIEASYANVPPEVKKALEDLQKNKEEGRLKLLAVLKVSRSLLEASGTPSSLLPYWEALSVEGLEEPGD